MEGGHEGGGWGVGDREGEIGRGQMGGGGRLGVGNGRERQGGGDGEGKREGEMGRGATGREGKEGGKYIECLSGMRFHFFLTLFTRATPGTPASITLKYIC